MDKSNISWDHCHAAKVFSSTSQRGSGLDSVEASPCVKMMSHSFAISKSDESWHRALGIYPCHQGKKMGWTVINPVLVVSASSLDVFFA